MHGSGSRASSLVAGRAEATGRTGCGPQMRTGREHFLGGAIPQGRKPKHSDVYLYTYERWCECHLSQASNDT